MKDGTVEILIAGGRDPVFANKEKLASESSVFLRLIDDLGLTQLELKDFDPDVAILFLDLFELENREDVHIDYANFRELHKLAMVFDFQWLVKRCLGWLEGEICKMTISMDYDEKLFLFEECRFIVNKWKKRESMDLLIWKMVCMNDHFFISRYMTNIETKALSQLDLMLMMSGSNTQVIMEIIVRNITGKASICENIKYLLQNINLALCFEQNEELCHQMFDLLSGLSELGYDDQSFLFKTFRDSVREVSSRKLLKNTKLLVDSRVEWRGWLQNCQTVDEIMKLVGNSRVNSMFVVVILLIYVARFNTPSIEEAEEFISALVSTVGSKSFKRVSFEFIDQILAVLRKSVRPEKVQLIAILRLIKDKVELSSQVENVHIYADSAKGAKIISRDFISKCAFEFKHPGLPNVQDCNRPGRCGLIIQRINGIGDSPEKVLCKKKDEYSGTNIHYHDIVVAEDMFYYKVWSCKFSDGSEVKVPFRWKWLCKLTGEFPGMFWSWLLPSIIELKSEKYCVAYNVKEYLVWKKQ